MGQEDVMHDREQMKTYKKNKMGLGPEKMLKTRVKKHLSCAKAVRAESQQLCSSSIIQMPCVWTTLMAPSQAANKL